jgi:hypothetical protein
MSNDQQSPFVPGARVAKPMLNLETGQKYYIAAFIDRVYDSGNFTLGRSTYKWKLKRPEAEPYFGCWAGLRPGGEVVFPWGLEDETTKRMKRELARRVDKLRARLQKLTDPCECGLERIPDIAVAVSSLERAVDELEAVAVAQEDAETAQ